MDDSRQYLKSDSGSFLDLLVEEIPDRIVTVGEVSDKIVTS